MTDTILIARIQIAIGVLISQIAIAYCSYRLGRSIERRTLSYQGERPCSTKELPKTTKLVEDDDPRYMDMTHEPDAEVLRGKK